MILKKDRSMVAVMGESKISDRPDCAGKIIKSRERNRWQVVMMGSNENRAGG